MGKWGLVELALPKFRGLSDGGGFKFPNRKFILASRVMPALPGRIRALLPERELSQLAAAACAWIDP